MSDVAANMLCLATPSAGFTTVLLSARLRCSTGTLAAAMPFANSANGPSYAQKSRGEQKLTSNTVMSEDILCARWVYTP